MKDLVRCPVAERLARAVVEPLHRLLNLGLRNALKVCLLREVLPQQPVRVLVDPSLPTRMRAREVEAGSQPLGDSRVVRELSAIVRRDGQDLRGQRAEHRHTRCCHFHRTLALDPAQPHELRLPLDQCQDGSPASATNDGVGLPVTDSALGSNGLRAGFDADATRDLPAPRMLPVALAALSAAAQVEVQRAASLLVSRDVLIDALVAHARSPLQPETTRDLLGTPLAAQKRLDSRPRLVADALA